MASAQACMNAFVGQDAYKRGPGRMLGATTCSDGRSISRPGVPTSLFSFIFLSYGGKPGKVCGLIQSSCATLTAGSKHWYTLMRRDAGDAVSGQLQLGFNWDVTARSLLSLKLAALENVLSQRQEILCALNPVPASTAQRWTRDAHKAQDAAAQVGSLSLPGE